MQGMMSFPPLHTDLPLWPIPSPYWQQSVVMVQFYSAQHSLWPWVYVQEELLSTCVWHVCVCSCVYLYALLCVCERGSSLFSGLKGKNVSSHPTYESVTPLHLHPLSAPGDQTRGSVNTLFIDCCVVEKWAHYFHSVMGYICFSGQRCSCVYRT